MLKVEYIASVQVVCNRLKRAMLRLTISTELKSSCGDDENASLVF
jgi:hypothetical protein